MASHSTGAALHNEDQAALGLMRLNYVFQRPQWCVLAWRKHFLA
jgi:hypothetical protein